MVKFIVSKNVYFYQILSKEMKLGKVYLLRNLFLIFSEWRKSSVRVRVRIRITGLVFLLRDRAWFFRLQYSFLLSYSQRFALYASIKCHSCSSLLPTIIDKRLTFVPLESLCSWGNFWTWTCTCSWLLLQMMRTKVRIDQSIIV